MTVDIFCPIFIYAYWMYILKSDTITSNDNGDNDYDNNNIVV